MSRISDCFAAAKAAGRKVLIPYVTAGDPGPGVTVPLMHAMVAAGADIIELGVPFSDPMAEGPVIQRAMERALVHAITMDDVLDMVQEFRQKDETTPVVIMGYLNPIEVKGYDVFASQAAAAGVDGILTVDIPPEEASDYIKAMQNNELDRIFLVSPTTSDARIKSINAASSGFIYYVSLKGVTGAGHLDAGAVKERVDHIASMSELPVGVGFGIKDADTAAAISAVADAVVVGSALVKRVEEHADSADAINTSVAELISEMRQAMDASSAAK